MARQRRQAVCHVVVESQRKHNADENEAGACENRHLGIKNAENPGEDD